MSSDSDNDASDFDSFEDQVPDDDGSDYHVARVRTRSGRASG
jgi:hypothetical protein